MKHTQQQVPHTAQSSGHKIVQLFSSYMFFELFSFKKYNEAVFMIPETILLEKGLIKEWLFNSSKQENKILKKKRQNSTPLNVLKSFCMNAGYNFNHTTTISQLLTEFTHLRQEQQRKHNSSYKVVQQKKSIEVITTDDEILSMTLWGFINLVAEGRYNEHTFYERWKMIREKVNNESRIDECYEVISVRKNHVVESRCHKIIALKTGEMTPMSSVELESDSFKNVSPPREQKVMQTKSIEGYKFFDTFLNKKFFTIAQQLVEFIEKNYKCIVEQVKTKYVINKNREPFLVCISQLTIKPIKKIHSEDQFQQYVQKGYMRVEEYLKCLNMYLVGHEKKAKANHFALVANVMKKSKCNGDFCKVRAKKIPHLSSEPGITGRPKHFNLDPAIHPMHKRTVFSDVVHAVRKRKVRVLQKMKQYDIIDYNPEQQIEESSEYEESDEETHKSIKVCQNCHSLYMHIQRFYEIDFKSGNLIEKKSSLLLNNQNLKIRSHSEKRLPPILNKTEIDKPVTFGDDPLAIKEQNQIHGLRSIEKTEKSKTFNLRSKSHTKLQSNQSSRQKDKQRQKPTNNGKVSRFEDLKKIKLDPIDIAVNNTASKGNRLLALSKSIQNSPITAINNRLSRNDTKMSKQPKAKNFQQAQINLLQRLQKLPSSSRQEFIYYSIKYYKDNLSQQIDRKCFSSEYLSNFYQFMMNSDLNLHPKNRIRKRPEISLKRLSQLTDYPEIVSKSAFHFDTLITDEKTIITFCVITTRMINGKNAVNTPFENVFIAHDIFDCFIEYIPLVKDILQSGVNKRFIMFNYPGQSHTIYNKEVPINLSQFSFILDKLIYRLSTQKEQLGFVNFRKDKFKFIGFGYGGYLLSSYLANNYQFYGKNLSGVMLVNTYKNISETIKEKLQALRTLYASDDEVAISEAFLFYSKAILSSQTDKDDLEYKSGLNPIRLEGRVHLLDSLLDMASFEANHCNTMVYNFEDIINCPVHIVYGRMNVLFTKTHAQRFMVYEDTNVKKQEIPMRKFIEIQGGHDLLADNYDDLQRYVEAFVLL